MQADNPFFPSMDWKHKHDYDPPDVYWTDITVIGSKYQVQIDVEHGGRRHRLIEMGSPWIKGDAPK
jgi:hypothetical protein